MPVRPGGDPRTRRTRLARWKATAQGISSTTDAEGARKHVGNPGSDAPVAAIRDASVLIASSSVPRAATCASKCARTRWTLTSLSSALYGGQRSTEKRERERYTAQRSSLSISVNIISTSISMTLLIIEEVLILQPIKNIYFHRFY